MTETGMATIARLRSRDPEEEIERLLDIINELLPLAEETARAEVVRRARAALEGRAP
jgi:hypothetical protein